MVVEKCTWRSPGLVIKGFLKYKSGSNGYLIRMICLSVEWTQNRKVGQILGWNGLQQGTGAHNEQALLASSAKHRTYFFNTD